MAFPPNKRLFDLIGSLYEIAGNQSSEAWLDVYKQMADLLSAGPGGLSLYLAEIRDFEILSTTLDQNLYRQYSEYYQYISPFRGRIVAMKAGDRFSRVKALSDKEFMRTEIYQDYYRKQDVFNYEYQVFLSERGVSAGVSFCRPSTMKNFSAAEINTMQILIRHLKNAFQIHRKFAELQRDNTVISECLEKISQSVVVLDKTGKVVFSTGSAGKLLAARDGLQVNRGGTISAAAPQDARKIKLLLKSVFAPAQAEDVDYTKLLQISRPSGARPLSIFVSPYYEKSGGAFFREPLAILFIKDPDEKVESIEPLLSAMYDLTAAEAKLAALLAQGKSIGEACELLGVKQNTIRTHLKRIFSKTQTTRQGDLVKLILSSLVNLQRV